jgi:hypothetical protein
MTVRPTSSIRSDKRASAVVSTVTNDVTRAEMIRLRYAMRARRRRAARVLARRAG